MQLLLLHLRRVQAELQGRIRDAATPLEGPGLRLGPADLHRLGVCSGLLRHVVDELAADAKEPRHPIFKSKLKGPGVLCPKPQTFAEVHLPSLGQDYVVVHLGGHGAVRIQDVGRRLQRHALRLGVDRHHLVEDAGVARKFVIINGRSKQIIEVNWDFIGILGIRTKNRRTTTCCSPISDLDLTLSRDQSKFVGTTILYNEAFNVEIPNLLSYSRPRISAL